MPLPEVQRRAVGKLEWLELRGEYLRTKEGTRPGDMRRFNAAVAEIKRRTAKYGNDVQYYRPGREVPKAPARRNPARRKKRAKRQHTEAEYKALRTAHTLSHSRSRTRTTTPSGEITETSARNETIRGRAHRYPGVEGAYARLLVHERELSNLKTDRLANRLTPAGRKRLHELEEHQKPLFAAYQKKLAGAMALERRKQSAETRRHNQQTGQSGSKRHQTRGKR